MTYTQALVADLRDMSPWYAGETRIVPARTLLRLDDVAGARLAEAGRYLKRTPDATVLREWLEAAWKPIWRDQQPTGGR